MTDRDIILECYLGDIVRGIIILLFTGHVTKCVTVSAGIILLLFVGDVFGPVVISD